MKKLIFSLLLIAGAGIAYSQYDYEAVLYSMKVYHSDARSTATGNAMGAIGANFISSSINPGGLALFRSSEFSITNSLWFASIKAEYLDNQLTRQKFNYNIPSFSFIIAQNLEKNGQPVKEGLVSYTFAAGSNRTWNYNSRIFASGVNKSSSILDFYAESAQGIAPENLPIVTGMAYDVYLIDNPDTLHPYHYITAMDTSNNRHILQNKTASLRGSNGEFNLSFAANFSNKVYVGATLGFPSINYHRNYEFTETNQESNPENYIGSSYKQNLDITGVGVNLGLGVVIRPFKFLRLGGSVQTPTFYSITEDYREEVGATLIKHSISPQYTYGTFEYNFTSPLKATASLALFAGKMGFVSVDYEYLDYSSAYFDAPNYHFIDENNAIKNKYHSVTNLRIGGELKLGIFSLRGGFENYQSPYTELFKPSSGDASLQAFSLGGGIREKNYYFDMAYRLMKKSEFFLPYSLESTNVEGIVENLTANNIVFTLGVKF